MEGLRDCLLKRKVLKRKRKKKKSGPSESDLERRMPLDFCSCNDGSGEWGEHVAIFPFVWLFFSITNWHKQRCSRKFSMVETNEFLITKKMSSGGGESRSAVNLGEKEVDGDEDD